MNCVDDEKLQRFVERRLDELEMAEVARHVVACEDCQNYVRFYANCLAAPEDELRDDEKAQIRGVADDAMALLLEKLKRQRASDAFSADVWRAICEAFGRREEIALAAADGQSGNQKQAASAADAGFFYFYSHGRKDDTDPNGWRARLFRPPSQGTSDRYLLQFLVEGLDGTPVSDGTLMFCGQSYAVANGRVFVSKKAFLEACGLRTISLRRSGGEEVPGAPVF